jgi:hypothetical protein
VREQFDSNSTPTDDSLFMVDVKYPFKSGSIPPIGEGWLLDRSLKKWFECTIFPVIFLYLEIEKREVRMRFEWTAGMAANIRRPVKVKNWW